MIQATRTRRTSGSVKCPDDEGPAGSPRRGPRGSDEASGSPAPGGSSPSQMVLEELGGSRHGCACEMRAQQRFVHVTCRRQRRGHTDQAFPWGAVWGRTGRHRTPAVRQWACKGHAPEDAVSNVLSFWTFWEPRFPGRRWIVCCLENDGQGVSIYLTEFTLILNTVCNLFPPLFT